MTRCFKTIYGTISLSLQIRDLSNVYQDGPCDAPKSVFGDGVTAADIELLYLMIRQVAWIDSG